jgi:hypothetical protein
LQRFFTALLAACVALEQEPMHLHDAAARNSEAGTTSSPAPAAVSAPYAISLRQVMSWLPAMP